MGRNTTVCPRREQGITEGLLGCWTAIPGCSCRQGGIRQPDGQVIQQFRQPQLDPARRMCVLAARAAQWHVEREEHKDLPSTRAGIVLQPPALADGHIGLPLPHGRLWSTRWAGHDHLRALLVSEPSPESCPCRIGDLTTVGGRIDG